MSNSTTISLEKQAIILKGIASQILQMSKPSFEVFNRMGQEFGIELNTVSNVNISNDVYSNNYLKS